MSPVSFQLFPNPSPSPSRISPNALPGITPEATEMVKKVLKDDYEKHHAFFNDQGFHNHVAHHVLAVWALGAPKDVIQAAYDHDKIIQRQAYKSPGDITRDNFNDHLGDENYYNAYVNYFIGAIKQKDAAAVLEEHVFSSAANFASKGQSGEHPKMLGRFLGSLVHPMIHIGYGVEFNMPGLVAEGLAQAAVHGNRTGGIVPASTFLADPVPSAGLQKPAAPHAFTILSRVLKDENIKINIKPKDNDIEVYTYVLDKWADVILGHVNEWADFDATDAHLVERKVEELQWTNVLIYALPGYSYSQVQGQEKKFNADFFSMHLVTSSLFLPSHIAVLSPHARHLLLRSYFAVSLTWYIARGKPDLHIKAFFDETAAFPIVAASQNGPGKISVLPLGSSTANPNPWFAILEQAIGHADDHLCKLQRTLAHYSALYGSRTAGKADFAETELLGADRLDGTLFVRAAALTAEKLGQDNLPPGYWDRSGFFAESK
ncbi:hypothetical protein Moror_2162 [Moniliophthora roreri MCA 2997]|uniref:HypA-like protein n=1 Tax=Moniliophthora roreri (strain MCA 2997) TaxID=1381753 RepID=V2WQ23_MONRO|nr:hypothetical protein Moror_2162 [Moniliophthora roreri MCA 2997]